MESVKPFDMAIQRLPSGGRFVTPLPKAASGKGNWRAILLPSTIFG